MQNLHRMCDFECHHHHHYQYNHLPLTISQNIESNIVYSSGQGYLQSSFSLMSPPLSIPVSSSPSVIPSLSELYQSINSNNHHTYNNSFNQQFQHGSQSQQNYLNQQNSFYKNGNLSDINNHAVYSYCNNYQCNENYYSFEYDGKYSNINDSQKNSNFFISNNYYKSLSNANDNISLSSSNQTFATNSPDSGSDSPSVPLNDIKPLVKREAVCVTESCSEKKEIKTKTRKHNRKFKDLFEPAIDLNQPNVTTIMQRPVDMGETKRYKRRNYEDLEKRRIYSCKYYGIKII